MTFINATWDGKRDYEATQVVAAEAESAPASYYRECTTAEWVTLKARGMQQLWICNGVRYFGWL